MTSKFEAENDRSSSRCLHHSAEDPCHVNDGNHTVLTACSLGEQDTKPVEWYFVCVHTIYVFVYFFADVLLHSIIGYWRHHVARLSVSLLTAHCGSRGWRLLLLGGELLAERCRTDDLMPSIPFLCLPPSRVDPKVLGLVYRAKSCTSVFLEGKLLLHAVRSATTNSHLSECIWIETLS